MVPGMGGLRDDLSKLPAIRPSPLGQENVSNSNPASCQATNNYRNQQAYQPEVSYPNQQQFSYYPVNDQLSINSGSASLSSSSTSLNSDYYNQASKYGMSGNQGYVNPIYQTSNQPSYQDQSTGFNRSDGVTTSNNSFASTNSYQQPALYGNYNMNYSQMSQPQASPVNQQFDYQNMPVQQPSTGPISDNHASTQQQQQSMNYNPNVSNPYLNPSNIQAQQVAYDQTQSLYQNQIAQQFQAPQTPQYPVSQTSVSQPQQYFAAQSAPQQVYPVAQSPVAPQYSSAQSFQTQNPMTQQTGPTPTSVVQQSTSHSIDQQYSTTYTQNSGVNQQQAQQSFVNSQAHNFAPDYGSQQNQFSYADRSAQPYLGNQYGDHLNQQNYACYTPTVNSVNSYMTAGDPQTGHSQTTQSANYVQPQDVIQSHVHMMNRPASESPQLQPNSIPTYSSAVNAMATNHSEMHVTQSQQQITSSSEKQQKPEAPKPTEIKSKNIDLLSGIDFTASSSSINNIPTLTPVKKTAEDSPKKILEPTLAATPVKLNDDLADLDFTSLTPITRQEPVKHLQPEIQKKLEDSFDDGAVLKQFHKEVEGLERFMETLTVKTLNGVTPLANKWKELQDLLVKDEANRSVSIARLFPDKNRSIDCLPYDHARVLLPTATDNYINAVLVKDCGSFGFILTQTPMLNTVNDYWEMVWSQKSNILVCLHSPNEVI